MTAPLLLQAGLDRRVPAPPEKRFLIGITVIVAMACTFVVANVEEQNKPIVPKEKVMLWNGKDFSGWKLFVQDAKYDVNKVWSVQKEVIIS